MKKIIPFLTFILITNMSLAHEPKYNNFNKLWKEVEQFEKEGLPKSALKVVEEIAAKAKTDTNAPQIVKTLMFKSKYALTLEEDAQLNIVNDFNEEIANSKFPTKNILESVLANLYWQYFNQNRYKFYNRTNTEEKVDVEDFRTWDLRTLFDEVQTHFRNSLESGLLLQQQKLSAYDDILNTQKDSKLFRPTLYDFLNHNALDFYKTDENSITKPAYKFEIDNPEFLADANTFSKLKIESKDVMSLQLNALNIYQDLIQFHLKDDNPTALADINIERLLFVKRHATFNDKETILLEALKNEVEQNKSHEVSALYNFEIASILNQQGSQYNPKTKESVQWKTKEALQLCKSVINKFPKSKGAEKCSILKQQILQKNLHLTAENFLPLQTNARLLVSYKNLNQLDFKVHKLTHRQLQQFNKTYRNDEKKKFIKKLDVTTQWQSNLRDETDYQNHTTEVLFPKLDNGIYLIYSEANDSSIYAFKTIQVTDFALVEQTDNDKNSYQVIDRNNGVPIVGAKVKISYKKNYRDSFKTKNLETDENGKVIIKKDNSRLTNVKVEVSHNKQKAYFGDYYINKQYNRDTKQKDTYKGFLFTDRSIYRPGQTVYFKGIAMQTKYERSSVLENELVYAVLYNVNHEEVKELELKTNEFGSVAAEFILPNDGLTGQYHIEFDAESGGIEMQTRTYFSVEEYKRPKFETKFNPVTETLKVNDSVTVQGEALAYAGSNITDAKVVYRVHRKVQYPRWYYWYRPWFTSEPQEITHGETTTNDKGEFEITFKALPDESVDKKSLPVFNYEITADVTDINGETRSATTVVNVGYHALIANISVDRKLDKTKKDHKLTIDTKNLNGEFVSAKGVIKIYKLKAPNKVLRPRPWNAPDYQEFSESEFNKLFPHDAYKDEYYSMNWEKGDLMFSEKFDTDKSKEVELGSIKRWESGQYIIKLESKDKFGQLVKDETRTTLFSDKDDTLADKQLFSITHKKSEYQPNDTVELTIASASENLTVFVDIEKDQKIINSYKFNLNNNKKLIKIPVTTKNVGGFAVHYSLSAFNSFQSGTSPITVPYPKTDLEIETLTFRDNLLPGTDETWNFKIKGPKGDKVSAELLASMYDASLDQFKGHSWDFNPIQNPIYYSRHHKNAGKSFGHGGFRIYNQTNNYSGYPRQSYDQLNWFGLHFGYGNRLYAKNIRIRGQASGINIQNEIEEVAVAFAMKADANLEEVVTESTETDLDEVVMIGYGTPNKEKSSNEEGTKDQINFKDVKIRKNLQETAFFFPQLQTDIDGNVSFSFTTPEALTKWKLQLLSHTKTLESAISTLEAVTQKELMVIPNVPRFLREGDQITISSKISNISDKNLSGQAVLQLFDALTGNKIDSKLENQDNVIPFSVNAKGNTQVSWDLSVPDDVQAVQYKVIAKAGDFSDGEQNALPVLTNRMLVTETLPMWIRSNQTKTFTLDKLKNNKSTSLKHHNLTLEMTSNPAWYAVQALPYLMEFPHECNEQIFSRYYANALASHIANSNPRIQEVFNQWKNTDALLSNLEKNQELKSILIQETPWLRDAQSETEQKKRIALLFDLNKMNNELQSAKRKLKQSQMPSGAWSWFNGGRANRYITQHIITGFGHLKHLKVEASDEKQMIEKTIRYLDAEFVQEYKDIRKYNKDVDLSKDHLSYTQLHYLYMRSFYPEIKKSNDVEEITKYYHTLIKKYWLSRSLYAKGLMALVADRMDDNSTSAKILKSLKENSITSEELGMYWKANTNSWYWYQAPIETQALLIEAFSEIENNTQSIDNLKIWLLKNKQTNRWKTTKATTEAVYALLLQGSDWLSVTDMVDVVLGGEPISPSKLENVKVEAGSGYYKTSWKTDEIKPEMANVKITKKGKGIAWGSLYWQYFEDLDKITSAETPLKLKKKLFLKTNTDLGEEIAEVSDSTKLKVGDLIRVRIELRSDRPMEFVHMKDMRASGLEPINVLSQYKWQDGLGYYESTKDASSNFFFDYLPKGVFVFEYDLRVNNAGDMSNGITTIQSMYAPEFSSHSEGVRISIE